MAVSPPYIMCLVCVANAGTATFWDGTQVPLCHTHHIALAPLIKKVSQASSSLAGRTIAGGSSVIQNAAAAALTATKRTSPQPSYSPPQSTGEYAAALKAKPPPPRSDDAELLALQETLKKAAVGARIDESRAESKAKAEAEYKGATDKLRARVVDGSIDKQYAHKELGDIISKLVSAMKYGAIEKVDAKRAADDFWKSAAEMKRTRSTEANKYMRTPPSSTWDPGEVESDEP